MRKYKLKVVLLAILGWSPLALAAGPGANCPAAVTLGFKNIVDGGAVFCDGGNFCDGGATGQYFEAVCNLNNPIKIATTLDGGAPVIVWADEGTADGGGFNDGQIQSIPVDGGVLKNLSPATEACPISLSVDQIQAVWVNAGTNCAFTDAGNAILDVPIDGGTVVTLVSGLQGIHNVVSDGTFAYFTVENNQHIFNNLVAGGANFCDGGNWCDAGPNAANQVSISAVEAVLLDAGASYPVTTLWTSLNGLATVPNSQQVCSWTNGLLNCPGVSIGNIQAFNNAGALTVANGILYWGPGGMSLNLDAGSVDGLGPIPFMWGASCVPPGAPVKDSMVGLDSGVLFQSGTGIVNQQCQWLANNTENSYHPIATDGTSVFYPCNSQPNNTTGLCSVPVNQVTNFSVQIAGEIVAASGGAAQTHFGDLLQNPAVYPGSMVLSYASATGWANFALDNDAGTMFASPTPLPTGLPTLLDGGISYGDGGINFYLSGVLPNGWEIVANYTGTQAIRNPAPPTSLVPGTPFPAISGETLDTVGNLDFVTPTGIDAGGIWILQPK